MYALAYWKGNSLCLRGRLQHVYVRALAYGKKKGNSVSVAPLQRVATLLRSLRRWESASCRARHGGQRGSERGGAVRCGRTSFHADLKKPMGNAARWKRPWRQRNGSGVRVGTRSFCHRPRLQLGSLHLKTGTMTWPTPPACAP